MARQLAYVVSEEGNVNIYHQRGKRGFCVVLVNDFRAADWKTIVRY
jgi:hypothetical protein